MHSTGIFQRSDHSVLRGTLMHKLAGAPRVLGFLSKLSKNGITEGFSALVPIFFIGY